MFILTENERLAILFGSIGIILIFILITVCFVCPVCYVHKKMKRKRSKEDTEMTCLRNTFETILFDKNCPPPPYEPPTRFAATKLSISTISSSDTDSIAGIPLPFINQIDFPALDVTEENSSSDSGSIFLALQYKRIVGEENKVFAQLRIDFKEASDLPFRDYGGRCDPYFIVILSEAKGTQLKRKKSGSIQLHKFSTTVVKKSQNPVYNETFFFPLEQKYVKKCLLKIEAWDQDKWANDTLLGEVKLGLKDISLFLLKEPSKELDLSLKLEDPKKSNGQVLLGLCYLPTAERMTLAVLKANNLKVEVNIPENIDFYVEAMAIYAGKIFERRKTSRRPFTSCPILNEMLMFDVPFPKLDHIVLLLTVRIRLARIFSEDERAEIKSSKELCIGKMVIGSSSRKSVVSHWNTMKNSPRRQVIEWHELW